MQYEGGESEEDEDSEHKKQRDSAYKKDGTPVYNNNRASVSSDIEIDSIEMEIERSNKNGFF